ncbi:MAG: DNA mismatch repair protein MutS [Ferruginibacter sp.]
MEIDKTTLTDLSIFNAEEEFSIFSKLNFTTTSRGKEQLQKNLNSPLTSLDDICDVQQTIQLLLNNMESWPRQISNGTIMVIESFFESTIDPIPSQSSSFSAYSYKLLHAPDFSLVKYSTGHCFDFIKGVQILVNNFRGNIPRPLKNLLDNAEKLISRPQFEIIAKNKLPGDITIAELLQLGHYIRYQYKRQIQELIQFYSQMDAWYSMAKAVKTYDLVFPEIKDSVKPFIESEGLYHILLNEPVAYDVTLNEKTNFLFLTGANMAGKSTFIKAIGSAVFLAHAGMGVPAKKMTISVFDGMLSNINVIDNIVKGESYFYNEVQRIKSTITKINDGRKWLILIDELFKGTNIQDAMKCSSTVIEGLLKINRSLFILSTHLYEIGEALQKHPNIIFNYFETTITGDQLEFNYQLKEGISNDRLGYLILKQEGVVKMLEDL